ncbi:MAG: hypothetical protein ABII71_03975 [Candidatus Micrarchaeota archaeon]
MRAGGKVEDRLVSGMERAGFPLAHRKNINGAFFRSLYPRAELIFNRGLDGKSSNFCILARRHDDGKLTLYFYDPDQNGLELKREQFIRSITLEKDASRGEVEQAIWQAKGAAMHKKPDHFFFVPHSHFGAITPPMGSRQAMQGLVPYDDGVSSLTDNLRKALFYHSDYYALTTHNSFEKQMFNLMSKSAALLGLMAVPSVELTAPLKEPNGPHILLWMANIEAALEVREDILYKRVPNSMASFFSGMGMYDMLDILFRMQGKDQLALGIAHPVNFNSPNLPIPIVGLFSAVETCALSLDEALLLSQRFDSIAMWNASLYAKNAEMRVSEPKLRKFLKEINREHIGNPNLWVNQTNLALATELNRANGINTHFETDEHKTLPFVLERRSGLYVIGADSLGMGMTVIEAPGQGRPGVEELIGMIRARILTMHGRVFAVMRKEAATVYAERAAIPPELKSMHRKYQNAGALRYVGMLAHDFFDFLFDGDFGKIDSMPGD